MSDISDLSDIQPNQDSKGKFTKGNTAKTGKRQKRLSSSEAREKLPLLIQRMILEAYKTPGWEKKFLHDDPAGYTRFLARMQSLQEVDDAKQAGTADATMTPQEAAEVLNLADGFEGDRAVKIQELEAEIRGLTGDPDKGETKKELKPTDATKLEAFRTFFKRLFTNENAYQNYQDYLKKRKKLKKDEARAEAERQRIEYLLVTKTGDDDDENSDKFFDTRDVPDVWNDDSEYPDRSNSDGRRENTRRLRLYG